MLRLFLFFLVLGGHFFSRVSAAVVLQPIGVTASNEAIASGPFEGLSAAERLIDQSGLSVGYTSGVTDFDTYFDSHPTHNGFLGGSSWATEINVTTATIDFDIGGEFFVDGLVLWNRGFNFGNQIGNFRLLADSDAAFSSPTTLGVYSASGDLGPNSSVGAELFSFSALDVSYIRMEVLTPFGPPPLIDDSLQAHPLLSAGEVAFRAIAVPESNTLTIMNLMVVGVVMTSWQSRLS